MIKAEGICNVLCLCAAKQREHKLKQDGRSRRFLMQRIKESLKDPNQPKQSES